VGTGARLFFKSVKKTLPAGTGFFDKARIGVSIRKGVEKKKTKRIGFRALLPSSYGKRCGDKKSGVAEADVGGKFMLSLGGEGNPTLPAGPRKRQLSPKNLQCWGNKHRCYQREVITQVLKRRGSPSGTRTGYCCFIGENEGRTWGANWGGQNVVDRGVSGACLGWGRSMPVGEGIGGGEKGSRRGLLRGKGETDCGTLLRT